MAFFKMFRYVLCKMKINKIFFKKVLLFLTVYDIIIKSQ